MSRGAPPDALPAGAADDDDDDAADEYDEPQELQTMAPPDT